MDASGSGINSAGLTNDDFRKFLATPRSHVAQKEKKQKKGKNNGEQEHRQRKFGPEIIGPEEKDGSSKQAYVYRDRAEERRRGMLEIKGEDDLNSSHCIILDRDLSAVSLEESKYLGGDIEHTHLVKGLDYALLSHARAEREKNKLRLGDGGNLMQEKHATRGNISRDEDTHSSLKGLTSGKTGQTLLTALQQLVHRGESDHNASKKKTTRRTRFLYAMKHEEKFEIPILRMRAEEDCPAEFDGAQNCDLPTQVVEEIARIMKYTMGPSNIRHCKPLEQKTAPSLFALDHSVLPQPEERTQSKPADEDDDIFADVGTNYEAERRVKYEGKVMETTSGKGPRYFDVEDLHCQERQSEIPQGTRVLGIDLGNVATVKEELIKRKEEEERIRRLKLLHAAENDGYDECYPGFVDSAGMLEDSDDGEDDQEPDKGDNAVQKKRQSLQENAKEKAKLESQLHNIQKIFEEKGYEHTTAFTKSEVATTESRIRDNLPNGDLINVLKKKRRI